MSNSWRRLKPNLARNTAWKLRRRRPAAPRQRLASAIPSLSIRQGSRRGHGKNAPRLLPSIADLAQRQLSDGIRLEMAQHLGDGHEGKASFSQALDDRRKR